MSMAARRRPAFPSGSVHRSQFSISARSPTKRRLDCGRPVAWKATRSRWRTSATGPTLHTRPTCGLSPCPGDIRSPKGAGTSSPCACRSRARAPAARGQRAVRSRSNWVGTFRFACPNSASRCPTMRSRRRRRPVTPCGRSSHAFSSATRICGRARPCPTSRQSAGWLTTPGRKSSSRSLFLTRPTRACRSSPPPRLRSARA